NTQAAAAKVLEIIKREAGPGAVESSIGYVGTQPTSFPINLIYLWTAGPHEAVLDVTLKRGSRVGVDALEERLRGALSREMPALRVSFEASGVVDKVMSGDAPNPIEVAVYGVKYEADKAFAEKIRDALSRISVLRDVQITQAFDYPTVQINVDRKRAGYMGLTMAKIGRALVPATSSSRYLLRNYWAEPESGITHQIQVEIPQGQVDSPEKLKDLPVTVNGGAVPLRRFAEIVPASTIGEYDRYNMQRMVTVTANVSGTDLGRAAAEVLRAVSALEAQRPHGATVEVRGQVQPMEEMLKGLGLGLAVAVAAILLLLTAYFESPRHSAIVLSTAPAVIVGVELSLLATGATFNVESLIGAIMATGIAVANAILLVSFAKHHKEGGAGSTEAAVEGAQARLRPILMTSIAMVAGMVPLASGLGEGGQEMAPLGVAVIGGLAAATAATLFILPLVYAAFGGSKPHRSSSLHPDDPSSPLHLRPGEPA
ncbi:MAG TPA: efflux RND transporter permease subunit, partial [Elusimicrobiota bacterium]|nr:efflux RND transporter permease subunit [Elusimicrobiota bacterium]